MYTTWLITIVPWRVKLLSVGESWGDTADIRKTGPLTKGPQTGLPEGGHTRGF